MSTPVVRRRRNSLKTVLTAAMRRGIIEVNRMDRGEVTAIGLDETLFFKLGQRRESALPAGGLWVHNRAIRNAVQQSRAEVLAELYETGALVESEHDEELIAALTATSDWGDELRQIGASDPDLLDR